MTLTLLKVKYDGAIGHPIYNFLLMVNSNICSFARYRPSKYEWPWVWSSKVAQGKSNAAVGLPIYDFLLVSKSNYMSIKLTPFRSFSHLTISVLSHLKISLLSLVRPKILTPPPPRHTLTPWGNFSKSNGFLLRSEGRPPPKIELIGLIIF